MRKWLLLAWCTCSLLLSRGAWAQTFEAPDAAGTRWFKGCTHAHTNRSGGDSSPEAVAEWYRDHGYRFLVLTDYYTVTVTERSARFPDGSFLLIPGEELTCLGKTTDVDLTAMNISQDIPILTAGTLVAGLQRGIDAIRAQGGVPVINHPNYKWRPDVSAILGTENCVLFELFNGNPQMHNEGDAAHPGTGQMWDQLLTAGMRIFGVAADDEFYLDDRTGRYAAPGRGWVVVRAPALEAGSIVAALERGSFYSSTGVELDDVRVTATRMEIRIRSDLGDQCETQFIGPQGRVLLQTRSNPAVYELIAADVGYVRARVTDSAGRCAWVQPVFVEGP